MTEDDREGIVYQRCEKRRGCPPAEVGEDGKRYRPKHDCKGTWVGALSTGNWTERGTRERIVVYGKTRKMAKNRIRDKALELNRTGIITNDKLTVRQWADEYLAIRVGDMRPNSYTATRGALKWVVKALGNKRLATLTPADIRALDNLQYAEGGRDGKGAATGAVHDTRSKLYTMLRAAEAEGHRVPQNVYLVRLPGTAKNDRRPLTMEETVKCLLVASQLPHGIRWAIALVYGVRLEEALGLSEDVLDFDSKAIRLDWQKQSLPYLDPKDKAKGFRLPQDYETIQLYKGYHLVDPKTEKGARVLPMEESFEEALLRWLPQRPASRCLNGVSLVFPNARGLPKSDREDRDEWYAIQDAAGVRHPSGRHYYVHECRNTAATRLGESKASDAVQTALMGHASIKTTHGYQTGEAEAMAAAVGTVLAEVRAAGWTEDSAADAESEKD